MPNFKIKRNRKPQKVATVEPTIMDCDEASEVEEDLDELMESCLKIADTPEEPENVPQYQEPPQRRPQREPPKPFEYKIPTNPVRRNPNIVPPDPRNNYRIPTRRPMFRKPTMPTPRRAPRRGRQTGRMRFRSHFGPDADYLSTQQKARLLLSSCFG
jgi:hypothetical protein